jgi:hypothetical protein
VSSSALEVSTAYSSVNEGIELVALGMFANLTKFGQTAAQKAAKLAESVTVQSRVLQEYELGAAVGSAGRNGVWKIHRARKRTSTGIVYLVSVLYAGHMITYYLPRCRSVHKRTSGRSVQFDIF